MNNKIALLILGIMSWGSVSLDASGYKFGGADTAANSIVYGGALTLFAAAAAEDASDLADKIKVNKTVLTVGSAGLAAFNIHKMGTSTDSFMDICMVVGTAYTAGLFARAVGRAVYGAKQRSSNVELNNSTPIAQLQQNVIPKDHSATTSSSLLWLLVGVPVAKKLLEVYSSNMRSNHFSPAPFLGTAAILTALGLGFNHFEKVRNTTQE